jgi:hypothetical protein
MFSAAHYHLRPGVASACAQWLGDAGGPWRGEPTGEARGAGSIRVVAFCRAELSTWMVRPTLPARRDTNSSWLTRFAASLRYGQRSSAKGSSTTSRCVSRSDIRLIQDLDSSAHGLVRRWRLIGAAWYLQSVASPSALSQPGIPTKPSAPGHDARCVRRVQLLAEPLRELIRVPRQLLLLQVHPQRRQQLRRPCQCELS